MVYIREAHPSDGWQVSANLQEKLEVAQPRTAGQRQEIANACVIGLRLSIPILIDNMDNRADLAFQGWPERLYVVSAQGQIVYQGGKGPYGFDIEELNRFLEPYLSVTAPETIAPVNSETS